MPNAKYLAYMPHQIPKTHFIKCAKSQKFCHMWTVPLQICNGTDEKWYNFYCFLFSFLSPLSSVYSFLFSLTSVFSPLFSTKNGINLHRFSSLSHHLWYIITNLSPVAFCIVIADQNRRGHRHWGEIGVFVTIVGTDVEILIVGIDVEVRWDLDRGLPVLVGFGCRCKWIHGFGLAMLVVLWVWVAWVLAVFSGFELLC